MTIWFWVCVGSTGFAQKTVCGKITDSLSGDVLPLAKIYDSTWKIVDITDLQGKFCLFANYNYIYIEKTGYHSLKIKLYKDNQEIKLCPEEIHLHPYEYKNINTEEYTRSSKQISLNNFQRSSHNIGGLLKTMPGIHLIEAGPVITKPILRGMTGNRVLTIYSGIRMEGQQWAADHGLEIDPSFVGEIEYNTGASNIENGSEPISGSLQIKPTMYRVREGREVQTYNGFFSNSLGFKTGISISETKVKKYKYIASMNYCRGGDSRAPKYILSNTAYEQSGGMFSIQLPKKTFEHEFLITSYLLNAGLLTASHFSGISAFQKAIDQGEPVIIYPFSYKISSPSQHVLHSLISYKMKIKTDFGKPLFLSLSYQNNYRTETDPDIIYNPNSTSRKKPGFIALLQSLQSHLQIPLVKYKYHIFYGGIQYNYQHQITGGKRYLIPAFQSQHISSYILYKFWGRKFKMEAGMRYDYRSILTRANINYKLKNGSHNYKGISSSAQITYTGIRKTELSYTLFQGWRPPGINELYANGIHGSAGFFEIGNDKLEKEQGFSHQLQINYQDKYSTYNIIIYKMKYSNYIHPLPGNLPVITISGTYPSLVYIQNSINISGIEYQHQVNYKYNKFLLGGNLSSNRIINTQNNLWQIPPTHLWFMHSREWGDYKKIKEIKSNWTMNFVGKKTEIRGITDYTPPPKSYLVFDINIQANYTVNKYYFEFFLKINNLLNTPYRDYLSRYRYYANEAGTDIHLKIIITHNPFMKHTHL